MYTKDIMLDTLTQLHNNLLTLKNIRKSTNKEIKKLNTLLNDRYSDRAKVTNDLNMYIQDLRIINDEIKLCKSAIKRFSTLLSKFI